MGMLFEAFIVAVVVAFAVREVIVTRRLLAQGEAAETDSDADARDPDVAAGASAGGEASKAPPA